MDNRTEGFTSVDEFFAFAFAGKATFTVTSKRTETHFTYTLRHWKKRPSVYFVTVKAPHGEMEMGMVHRDRVASLGLARTDRTEVGEDAPSAKAFTWLFKQMAKGAMPTEATVQHDGRCGVCARKLTHPRSIESGIGPECAAKLGCEAIAA